VSGITCTKPVSLPQAADLSGNTVIALPTITESKGQHLSGSDPSTTCLYPPTSTKQRSLSLAAAAAMPSNDRKIFTVTPTHDPILNV
jgi:hypothetical protein